ncbi:MAG: glycosyltransferase [Nodosilinea sp.]
MGPVGIVSIGRNEGERLKRSLTSILTHGPDSLWMVYVDSGSTDGSVAYAQSRGVTVVELDQTVPFTAARARNAGFEQLLKTCPALEYVQFLDGDCELVEGWLQAALATLESSPDTLAVCGWRQEKYPHATVFNRICAVEWRLGSLGAVTQFGGDVLLRAKPLQAVGGYNAAVIAAEDDELSVRLRQGGGQIVRIDVNSTRHDADMHTLSQWWQRGVRAGYGYAQVNALHGESPEGKFRADVRRLVLWGGLVPLIAVGLAPWTGGVSLGLLLKYPLTAVRVADATHRQGWPWADSVPWGISCALAAFPGLVGLLYYRFNHAMRRADQIIEYKGSGKSAI